MSTVPVNPTLARDTEGHLVLEQQWKVIATNQTEVSLMLGGMSPGGKVTFAHKHLLAPSKSRTDDEKAGNRARRRLDNKEYQRKKTAGMQHRDKWGLAKGANTTIHLSQCALPLVLLAIANAILASWKHDSKDVVVDFGTHCVYRHDINGNQLGQPATRVTVNVHRLGSSGHVYALMHLVETAP